jgi:hypothetical protein
MNEFRYALAPQGELILRQQPDFQLELALRRAKIRAFGVAALLKRRNDPWRKPCILINIIISRHPRRVRR